MARKNGRILPGNEGTLARPLFFVMTLLVLLFQEEKMAFVSRCFLRLCMRFGYAEARNFSLTAFHFPLRKRR